MPLLFEGAGGLGQAAEALLDMRAWIFPGPNRTATVLLAPCEENVERERSFAFSRCAIQVVFPPLRGN